MRTAGSDQAGGFMLTNTRAHRVSPHLKSLGAQSRIRKQAGHRNRPRAFSMLSGPISGRLSWWSFTDKG